MLSALQRLGEVRQDSAHPLLVVGGASGLWVAALFAPRSFSGSANTAFPQAAYAGEDPATAMACLVTWLDGETPSPYVTNRTGYHLFDGELMPNRHPGDVVRWEQLPFLTVPFASSDAPGFLPAAATLSGGGDIDESGLVDADEPVRHPQGTPAKDSSLDWLGWAILVLAILMPLMAMTV
jgi:hypothetical protein